jgi:hypothetical protein
LNDAADQAGARFVFQVNEDEAMIFRQLFIQNQKPYVSRRLTIGIPLIGFVSVIVPVWLAYDRDLLSIHTVLIAEWSFAVGYLGLLIAGTLSARRLYRDLFRATRSPQVSYDCSFDDAGLTIRKGALEIRMTWDAISVVQDARSLVAFWYDPTQGFLIPGRVFGDATARIAFAAWATDRVRAAGAPRAAAAPA